MLVFNNSGLLVPDSIIDSTIEEFETTFVIGKERERRLEIYENYQRYNTELKEITGLQQLHQWINGSYVSKARNPGDIDMVTFIPNDLILKIGSGIERFVYPKSEKDFGVDAYIVEEYVSGHVDYNNYLADRAYYWIDRFTKTRRIRGNKLAKGFINLVV